MAAKWKRLHAKIIAAGKTPCSSAVVRGKDTIRCQGVQGHRGRHRRGEFFWDGILTDDQVLAIVIEVEKEKPWE